MRSTKFLGSVLVLLAVVALAGCGGSSSSSSGGSTESSSGSSTESSSSDYLTGVKANVANLFGPMGTFAEEPTESPTGSQKHKKVAIMSCGQQVGACAEATGAAEEAAHALGWETTLFDAKLNLPSAVTGIRSAVAQGVDGIFVYYIDCQYIKAGLQEAKEAGIPVVAAESRDCSETNPGSPSLFTYVVHYAGGLTFAEQEKAWAKVGAEYAIAHFNGEAHAISFAEDNAAEDQSVSYIEESFEECSGCTLTAVKFPASAYGTRLQEIAEQELLKHPDTNTVLPSFDAIALEVYPAVRSSGKAEEMLFLTGAGTEAGLDIIREGGTDGFAINGPFEWEGMGGIDALGHIFAGQKPAPIGLGVQLIDAEHNLPESGPAKSPVDFRAMYEKAWGVKVPQK